MSIEDRHIIDEFVDREALLEHMFLLECFSGSEAEVAADTIIQGRALFVVEAVAQNLSERRERLSYKRNMYETEVKRIEMSIADIDAVLSDKNKLDSESNNLNATLDEYTNWLGHKGSYDKFLNTLLGKPPITLWLRRGSSDFITHSLTSWITEHEQELRDRFGQHFPNLARTSHILARTRVYEWPNSKHIDNIVTRNNDSELGLVIENPYMFLNECLCLEGFGINSAITVMCIAEMQRLEGERS